MKPRYQSSCLTLLMCLLCISKASFFANHWMGFLNLCQTKFKDRSMKTESLLRFTQILWVYLFRYCESSQATQARVHQLVKLLFPIGRRIVSPPECNLDFFIYIVYMIGVKMNSWTITHVIGYLLTCDGSIDTWSPERMTIGIESLSLLYDAWTEGVQKPSFPSMLLPARKKRSGTLSDKQLATLKPLHETLQKIFDGLHSYVGLYLLDDEKSRTISPLRASFSTGNIFNEGFQQDKEQPQASLIASIPNNRIPYLELHKILVQWVPKLPIAFEMDKMIDVLCTYSLHIDKKLCDTSIQALTTLAEADASLFASILIALEKRVIAITDRQFDLLSTFYVRQEINVEQQHSGILEIYLSFYLKGKEYTNNLPIDALCLYLLCSPYAHLRKLVLQILANSTSFINRVLSHFGLTNVAGASTKRGLDEWSYNFSSFMSYCVDFLSRDSIKKAIQFSLERVTYLNTFMTPVDTGLLWTTMPRSPSDETLVHWKRCSTLVVLGIHYLSNPREVISGFIALLSSDFSNVRETVHVVLSHTAPSHQTLLLDEVIPLVQQVSEDLKQRSGKRFYPPKKLTKLDRLRVELPKLLTLIKHFPSNSLPHMVTLFKGFRNFLIDQKYNSDLDTVRSTFCLCVHHFFSCEFEFEQEKSFEELRPSLFQLLHEWDEPGATLAMISLLRTKISFKPNSLPNPSANFTNPLVPGEENFHVESIFTWISGLLEVPSMVSMPREALKNMLLFNDSSSTLFETIIQKCYSLPPTESKYHPFFLAITDIYLLKEETPWVATRLEVLLMLAITKLSDTDTLIRRSSLNVLLRLQDRAFLNLHLTTLESVWHRPMHFQLSHIHILGRLSHSHPQWIYPCLSELFYRLSICHPTLHHTLLTLLPLLLRNIKLDPDIFSNKTRFILDNLLYFTISHAALHSLKVSKCWLSLTSDSMDNLKTIIRYFVFQAQLTSNSISIIHFQSVLSFFKNLDAVFTNILSYLAPTSFIFKQPSNMDIPINDHTFFVADLSKVLPKVPQQWTEGVVAALLISGLIPHMSSFLIEQSIALFLVISLVLSDHPDFFVSNEMKSLLISVLRREDLPFHSLETLIPFIVNLLTKDILDAWNTLSLCWASTCTILHVAIQCLKMFRLTLRVPFIRQLNELIELFKQASSQTNQTVFAMECLASIHAVLKHPHFMCASTSLIPCLQIIILQFLSAEPLHLEHLVNILDRLLDLLSSEQLILSMGESKEMGSLTLILLRAFQNTGFDPCRVLLNRLLTIEDSPSLVQKPILILLSNIPFLVQLPLPSWIDAFCFLLSQKISAFENGVNLKRALLVWRKSRAKSTEDFIQNLCILLKPIILEQSHYYLPIIFHFLASPNRAYLETYLLFLKVMLLQLQLDESHLVHVSMIQLLLELAQSNDVLASTALQVLDCLFQTMPRMTRSGTMLPLPRVSTKASLSPTTPMPDSDLTSNVSCTFLMESTDLILDIPPFPSMQNGSSLPRPLTDDGDPIFSNIGSKTLSVTSLSSLSTTSSGSSPSSNLFEPMGQAPLSPTVALMTPLPPSPNTLPSTPLVEAWVHTVTSIFSLPPLPPSPLLPREETELMKLEEIKSDVEHM
ncbi:Cell morphogenesis protein PAG1 [Coelomomyces lativittatus]|nr:Cell morphogenesis protein PAG1 [Coelomomyces lativittatus]